MAKFENSKIPLNLQFFGGRGASGSLGGGSGEKITSDETPITRKMYDESDPVRKEGLGQFISAVEDANDSDFNGIGKMLETMAVASNVSNPAVLAYYKEGGGGVAINELFVDSNSDARYDATVASKYHPSRGNESGVFAVMSHEVGHAVTEACAVAKGMSFEAYSKKVVESAARKVGAKKIETFAQNISGYAKDSYPECIAEAFADVRCNGSKAKAESKAIYDILKKDYK